MTIFYSCQEGRRWHCGALIRKLRPEQTSIAIGLGANVHQSLWEAYRGSGITRAWIGSKGEVLALMGVSGPMLASEGTVWLALSVEATHYPRRIIIEARKQLTYIMLFKDRIYADPFVADPASVRFAEHLGFVEIPNTDPMAYVKRERGAIPMVFSLNAEAYVPKRVERVN